MYLVKEILVSVYTQSNVAHISLLVQPCSVLLVKIKQYLIFCFRNSLFILTNFYYSSFSYCFFLKYIFRVLIENRAHLVVFCKVFPSLSAINKLLHLSLPSVTLTLPFMSHKGANPIWDLLTMSLEALKVCLPRPFETVLEHYSLTFANNCSLVP